MKVTRTAAIILLAAFLLGLMPAIGLAQVKEAPTRDKIADKYKWDLTDFFKNDSLWQVEFDALKLRIPDMLTYQGKLAQSAKNLSACLALNDTLNMRAHRLYAYSSLKFDEDQRVSKYQGMRKQAYGLYAQVNEVASFIEPEILTIPDATVKTFLASDPKLATYKFYIDDIIRRKAHIKSPDVEEVLALAAPVTNGPTNTFNMIDNADVKYPSIKDENGQEIELTRGRAGQIMESPNRQLRRETSQAISDTYQKYKNSLAATLSASVDGDLFYTKARGYNTCLERALDGDSIPPEVFFNLIKAASNNLAPLHKYMALRKKVLAVDTLFGFDLAVPLVPEYKMQFTYEQAEQYMLQGLKPLGATYLKDVQTVLNSNWIDVYETQGKESGGYTWGSYMAHPVMLLNFNGTLGEVFTLAHEMGHVMHNYYTNRNEPYIYAGHSRFTAEVASTCNEAIMIKYMLAHAKDKNEKLYLLNYYIDQIIGTFYTQVWFAEYELKIHETVEKGGALSTDSLRYFYRQIYQKYYGPDIFIPEDRDLGGLRISHFYTMYYVYQYATSYAASQMLSKKIMEGDKKAVAAYNEFTRTGSSAYPVDILKKAGVDMTTTEPYDNTIKIFSQLVDEYEKLLLKK
jgi:oligoendopeptidase F